MLFFLAAALADPPAQPVPTRMATLCDEICLETFPIDAQLGTMLRFAHQLRQPN